MECRVHCPGLLRRGQFLPRLFALGEETHRIGSDKRLRQNKKPVERRAAARGHDVDDAGRHRLDSRIADDDRRDCDARGLPQEGAFTRIGLDQLDPAYAQDRQYQTWKPCAAAEVYEALRGRRDMREKLGRIEEVTTPKIAERGGADQVDVRGPADEQIGIGFEPRQCFT